MRHPLLAKLAAVSTVGIVLLVALHAVAGVIEERNARQRGAEEGVADSLAGAQRVVGPLLRLRCDESWEPAPDGDGSRHHPAVQHRTLTVEAWPRALALDVNARTEPRYRGLFKINGYLATQAISADWDIPDLPIPPPTDPELRNVRLSCDEPAIAVAVADARGIRDAVLKVGGAAVPLQPGSGLPFAPAGLHATLPRAGRGGPIHVDVVLALAGTSRIAWVPLGDQTRIRMTSDWPHPSFGGRFLPVERTVAGGGFDAQWQVSALATSARDALHAGLAPCAWQSESADREGADAAAGCIDTFGVGFVDPVNGYLLDERAVKYGVLFVALTFAVVAWIEVLRRVRVHPIQYLLVGAALTIFFLLLLALGEHVGFGRAYTIASVACTVLLTYYGVYVLGGLRVGAAFGAAIAALYASLYALLKLEQTSLLLGSLLLFAVLAAAMVATRRMDWYQLADGLNDNPAASTVNEASLRGTPS